MWSCYETRIDMLLNTDIDQVTIFQKTNAGEISFLSIDFYIIPYTVK